MPLRLPAVAGQFYPGNARELAENVSQALNQAKAARQQPPLPALALLLPHAGHVFCGHVIAATLARAALPSRLILLGPNHTGEGAPVAVWPDGAWRTPLGDTPIDEEVARLLLSPLADMGEESASPFSADCQAHLREHSLEVILPFLQAAVPNLQITPVRVSCHPQMLELLGIHMAIVMNHLAEQGQPVGIVISSDMNHYADEATTCQLDEMALNAFLSLDPVTLFNTVAGKNISMCGILPATAALFACRALGASRVDFVGHTTSAEVSGDTQRVVGYAGAIVVAPE